MNENLKELIQQATTPSVRFQEVSEELTHIYPGTFDKKYFAELIVGECFKAAMIESKGHFNPVDLMNNMKVRVGIEQ